MLLLEKKVISARKKGHKSLRKSTIMRTTMSMQMEMRSSALSAPALLLFCSVPALRPSAAAS